MAIYNLSCDNCRVIYEDVEHSIKEDHPPCPKCNGKLDVYFPGTNIAWRMGTTGINKSLPGDLQKYYAKQKDNDRYTASEMAKDITFPDGTKHKGTQNYTREKVIDQSIFKPEFRNKP